jgi:desulfoferrodoxin (superoxide reductase-like protein)
MLILVASVLFTSFAGPVFAVVPEVRSVVPWNNGRSVILNVTVYHTPEISAHHVDAIEVTMGANTTDLSISVQNLSSDDTFTVPYDLGPVSGTPTITVRAHCNVHGWSTVNWSGVIPEFQVLVLLLALLLTGSIAALFNRKIKLCPRKSI